MSAHVRRLLVEPEHDGFRLDNFLTALLPDHSRSQIQRLIKDGHLRRPLDSPGRGHSLTAGPVEAPARVEGAPKASSIVHEGQEFELDIPAPVAAAPEAEELPLRIMYQDPDVVVLDKPA